MATNGETSRSRRILAERKLNFIGRYTPPGLLDVNSLLRFHYQSQPMVLGHLDAQVPH